MKHALEPIREHEHIIENKTLKEKIKQIDEKYDIIIKENKELKQMINEKSKYMLKLHNDVLKFKNNLKANNQPVKVKYNTTLNTIKDFKRVSKSRSKPKALDPKHSKTKKEKPLNNMSFSTNMSRLGKIYFLK